MVGPHSEMAANGQGPTVAPADPTAARRCHRLSPDALIIRAAALPIRPAWPAGAKRGIATRSSPLPQPMSRCFGVRRRTQKNADSSLASPAYAPAPARHRGAGEANERRSREMAGVVDPLNARVADGRISTSFSVRGPAPAGCTPPEACREAASGWRD